MRIRLFFSLSFLSQLKSWTFYLKDLRLMKLDIGILSVLLTQDDSPSICLSNVDLKVEFSLANTILKLVVPEIYYSKQN